MGYRLYFCKRDDRCDVMEFINNHWMKGHVLSQSRDMFDWQYYNPVMDEFNVAIARDEESGQVLAMMGKIPGNFYDNSIKPGDTMTWGSIWKRQEDADPYLGVELFKFVLEHSPSPYAACGINAYIARLYRKLKMETGTLDRLVIINTKIKEYRLASFQGKINNEIPESRVNLLKVEEEWLFEHALEVNALHPRHVIPCKTVTHIVNRYIKHPWYQYGVWGIFQTSQLKGILVTRQCSYKSACALRIVDFLGDNAALEGLAFPIQKILEEVGAEYADIYHRGLDNEQMVKSGFLYMDAQLCREMIIPNYYEPFVQENVSVMYAVTPVEGKTIRLFKGDSDQDRPNMILPGRNVF